MSSVAATPLAREAAAGARCDSSAWSGSPNSSVESAAPVISCAHAGSVAHYPRLARAPQRTPHVAAGSHPILTGAAHRTSSTRRRGRSTRHTSWKVSGASKAIFRATTAALRAPFSSRTGSRSSCVGSRSLPVAAHDHPRRSLELAQPPRFCSCVHSHQQLRMQAQLVSCTSFTAS